ncbi:class I SAM-dependent methyltransferase [Streptomyces varsoviensis]|nr:class I SAM-dependent methyltransferase [Streptomyces varsoviensis]
MEPDERAAPQWADCYRALVARKTDDIPALRTVLAAAPPGEVLELGAGFGRLALAAARDGRQVVAVEPSRMMLDHRDAFFEGVPADIRRRVDWRVADARQSDDRERDAGRYAAVVCGYNGLNEIVDGLPEVIDGAARALAPGGLLHLDWCADPYERSGLVEFYDYLEFSGQRWAVFTIVQELPGGRHDLTLMYERVDGVTARERLYQVVPRRTWPREDVLRLAAAAGLEHHQALSGGNVMVFVNKGGSRSRADR